MVDVITIDERMQISKAVTARTGQAATLRLANGADLAGTIVSHGDTVVIAVAGTHWTVALSAILAVADA